MSAYVQGFLPQHGVLAVAAHATNLARLVADFHVQALEAVVVVEVVMVVLGALDMPFHGVPLGISCAEVQHGPSAHPKPLVLRLPALAPGADFKAVVMLAFPYRTGQEVCANPRLGEVRAVSTAVHRRSQHMSGPMLETRAACSTAAGPGGEIGYNAVVRAGDQAGLLERRSRGEEFTYPLRNRRAVRGAHAMDFASLDAVLGRDALRSPRFELVGLEGG